VTHSPTDKQLTSSIRFLEESSSVRYGPSPICRNNLRRSQTAKSPNTASFSLKGEEFHGPVTRLSMSSKEYPLPLYRAG